MKHGKEAENILNKIAEELSSFSDEEFFEFCNKLKEALSS